MSASVCCRLKYVGAERRRVPSPIADTFSSQRFIGSLNEKCHSCIHEKYLDPDGAEEV